MDEESLINTLLPAVDEQLKSEQTPYVGATFVRLVKTEGINADDAKKLIAICLASETSMVLAENRKFDAANYQKMLDQLPELPF